jgi:hypothetical protein
MKKYVSLAIVAAMAALAMAQQPNDHQQVSAEQAIDPQLNLTPEMLLYLQAMRRYDDPKQAVRRNAEQKADQRRARLAALKWYGFSNQRPQAAPTPFTTTYSPVWTGNVWDPYRWVGGSYPYPALRVDYFPLP